VIPWPLKVENSDVMAKTKVVEKEMVVRKTKNKGHHFLSY